MQDVRMSPPIPLCCPVHTDAQCSWPIGHEAEHGDARSDDWPSPVRLPAGWIVDKPRDGLLLSITDSERTVAARFSVTDSEVLVTSSEPFPRSGVMRRAYSARFDPVTGVHTPADGFSARWFAHHSAATATFARIARSLPLR